MILEDSVILFHNSHVYKTSNCSARESLNYHTWFGDKMKSCPRFETTSTYELNQSCTLYLRGTEHLKRQLGVKEKEW